MVWCDKMEKAGELLDEARNAQGNHLKIQSLDEDIFDDFKVNFKKYFKE